MEVVVGVATAEEEAMEDAGVAGVEDVEVGDMAETAEGMGEMEDMKAVGVEDMAEIREALEGVEVVAGLGEVETQVGMEGGMALEAVVAIGMTAVAMAVVAMSPR